MNERSRRVNVRWDIQVNKPQAEGMPKPSKCVSYSSVLTNPTCQKRLEKTKKIIFFHFLMSSIRQVPEYK